MSCTQAGKGQPKAYRSTHATNLLTWLEITSKSALRGLSYAGDKSTVQYSKACRWCAGGAWISLC